MKKKRIANLVMVAVILVIAAAGVLTVGQIRGWFDADDGTYAVLRDMRGVINLERDGVSYPVEEKTVLRAGDKLSCDPGATAIIQAGESTLTVGEKACMTVLDPATDSFTAELLSGEVFANCENTAVLTFDGKKAELSQATALISVRAGAQSISVLRGRVGSASAGHILNYIGDEESVGNLDIRSLNDFTVTQIRKYDGEASLCFTEEDLDILMAERQQTLQELISSQTKPTTPGTETDEPEQTEPATEPSTGDTEPSVRPDDTSPTEPEDSAGETQVPVTDPTEPAGTTLPPETTEPSDAEKPTEPSEPEKPTEPPVTEKPTEPSVTEKPTEPAVTEKPTEPPVTEKPTEPPTTAPETVPPSSGGSCTITIRCDTILANMDDLEPGKAEFVPEDGVILYPVTVEFEGGETVFDVLKRVCDIAGIQLEYSWTPLYDSYYIEGINYLYEFDCGNESGWMYKVNGWFPNYGCSSYTLKNGDVIVWAYTCQGLGTDVGAPEWTG